MHVSEESDWEISLIEIYYKIFSGSYEDFRKPKTLLEIHNIVSKV